jgi:hypothetical protein
MDANERLAEQEDRNSGLAKSKKKVEQDNESLKKIITELEMTIKKQEAEKQSKDHQIRSLQDEIAAQDEVIAKVNKEKKHQEEVFIIFKHPVIVFSQCKFQVNRKLLEDIQAEEDKVNHLNKVKNKLEQTLDEV